MQEIPLDCVVKTARLAAETKSQEVNTVRIYFFLAQQDNADIPGQDAGIQAPSILRLYCL